MSLSTSHLAYTDCEEAFDRAISADRGIRIRVANQDAGIFFRMRCHKFRQLKRDEAKRIYPDGDPKHGVTPYDTIVIRIRRDGEAYYCYMQQTTLPGEIEELTDDTAAGASGPDRANGVDAGAMPSDLGQRSDERVRHPLQDQREEGANELPVRSPQGIRRV